MYFRTVVLSMYLLKPWNWQHSSFFSFLHPCGCNKMFHILHSLFSFPSGFLQGCCHLPRLGRHRFLMYYHSASHSRSCFQFCSYSSRLSCMLPETNHHVNVTWPGYPSPSGETTAEVLQGPSVFRSSQWSEEGGEPLTSSISYYEFWEEWVNCTSVPQAISSTLRLSQLDNIAIIQIGKSEIVSTGALYTVFPF